MNKMANAAPADGSRVSFAPESDINCDYRRSARGQKRLTHCKTNASRRTAQRRHFRNQIVPTAGCKKPSHFLLS